MLFQVGLQVVVQAEGFAAFLAGERLLTCVTEHVPLEFGLVLALLSTYFANYPSPDKGRVCIDFTEVDLAQVVANGRLGQVVE